MKELLSTGTVELESELEGRVGISYKKTMYKTGVTLNGDIVLDGEVIGNVFYRDGVDGCRISMSIKTPKALTAEERESVVTAAIKDINSIM